MRWQPSWVSRPKASGDVAADYRADPNPTPIYMLQGATGEKRRNAPLFFTWLGLAPDPLPAITSRCNCEHTTPPAVTQSHKQVHADTCSRSHTWCYSIDPTQCTHACISLSRSRASAQTHTHTHTHNYLLNANACTLQTGPRRDPACSMPHPPSAEEVLFLMAATWRRSPDFTEDTSTEPRQGYTMALSPIPSVGRAGG